MKAASAAVLFFVIICIATIVNALKAKAGIKKL
jgi:hypothetical protein